MAKIANKDEYALKSPVHVKDYFPITDYLTGKTKTVEVGELEAVDSTPPADSESQIDGVPNGNGTYTWVKYATDVNGAGITDNPTAETTYIGLAYNKTSPFESSDPADYIWGLISGDNFWTDDSGARHYTWIKYADTPISGISDDPLGKAYIGLAYDKPTAIESEVYSDYIWSKVLSNNGTDGIPVVGTTLYTWVKYADDINGVGISDSPVGKTHIGLAYNKDTFEESDTPADYTWGLINGDNVDSEGKYTWVKYADTPISGISDSPIGKSYIGLRFNNDSSVETEIYEDYQWSLLNANSNGDTDGGGLPTPTESLYTWIKFADDNAGTGLSDDPTGKFYIGIAINKPTEIESDDPTDYFWNLIGGSQPYTGADGKTYYIWTKYSNSPDGANLSDSPTGMSYIGLAYNKPTSVESTDPADYEWALFLGEGVINQPKWLYTWVKFADDVDGNGISDFPNGKEFMGLAYDKETATESLDPADYVWNPIRGDQGYTGADGKTHYTWVKYALTPDSISIYDSPSGMKWMGMAFNKTTSVESDDYNDYTWYPFSESGDGSDNTPSTVNQNNLIRVIKVPIEDLISLDDEGLADYIMKNGLDVAEDENVVYEITGYTPPNTKVLDVLINLDLSVTALDTTTADLLWTANGDDAIVRYDLLYVPTKGGSYSLISLGSEVTNQITGLATGTEYNAYVIGYDTLGNLKKSNIITFSTVEVFTALTPNISVDAITDETVDLSWNMETSFNVDRYELYQSIDGGGFVKIYDGANTSFQDIDLESETLHQYYVIGYSGITASTQSATVSATTLEAESPPLTAPVISFLGNSLHTIIIGISVPPLEESIIKSYVIEYRVLGTINWTIMNGENETVQTLSNLNSGTTYEIRLRSVSDLIYSDYSNTLVASTLIDLGADIKLSLLNEPVSYFEGKSKLRYPTNAYTSPNFGTGSGGGFIPHAIQKGMSIRINIRFSAKGNIKYSQEYDRTFIVGADYANVRDWFEAEVVDLGSFGNNYTWNGVDDIGGNVVCGAGLAETNNYKSGYGFGKSGDCAEALEQFWVVPHRKGTASRDITTFVAFTFQPNGVLEVKNGTPDSLVVVSASLAVRNSSNQIIFGYLYFDSLGTDLFSTAPKDLLITLDSNGEFKDHFGFSISEPSGTKYIINTTIVQSENGINANQGTSQLTYIKT